MIDESGTVKRMTDPRRNYCGQKDGYPQTGHIRWGLESYIAARSCWTPSRPQSPRRVAEALIHTRSEGLHLNSSDGNSTTGLGEVREERSPVLLCIRD